MSAVSPHSCRNGIAIERSPSFAERASFAAVEAAPRTSLWTRINTLACSAIGRNVAWCVAGSGVAQGGAFLSSVVLARVLGRKVFGEFALVQSTITALTYLASLGLGLTATKYISAYRATQPERIGKVLALSSLLVILAGLIFSVGLIVCAPFLAVRADHANMTASLRISTVCIFFLNLTGYQLGILAGFEAFQRIAWSGAIAGLASPLLSWWGAHRFGLSGAVAAQCASALLLWVLYEVAVRSECRKRGISVEYRGAWAERPILNRVAIPAAACGMVASLAGWGSNTILVRSSGYAELALFSAASNMRSLVIFLPSLILRVVSPRLNFLFSNGALSRYSRVFWHTVSVNGGLALLGAVAVFLGGQQFLRLFGKEFAGPNRLLALILGSVVIEVIATNLYLALFAGGRFWRNLGVMCLWTALLLVGSAAAAPRYGAAGVAAAYLASWIVAGVLYASEARKQTREGASS